MGVTYKVKIVSHPSDCRWYFEYVWLLGYKRTISDERTSLVSNIQSSNNYSEVSWIRTPTMKFLVVLLLTALVYGYVSAEMSKKFCGPDLSEIVAKLCWNVEMVKRGNGWWMRPQGGRVLGGMRDKRGLVDECCYKPCTVDELLTYC